MEPIGRKYKEEYQMVDLVYVPNIGEVALQGGTSSTDTQGRTSAPLEITATAVANQRVNAQSGDFVAGSIADLVTLLALLDIGQENMANSLSITIASDQTPLTSATATQSNVASSASNVAILALNTARKGAFVFNDSTSALYLSF